MRTEDEIKRLREKILAVFKAVGGPPKPITPEWLEVAAVAGMVKKEDLQDGSYYYGTCRNACVARWSAATQQFTYMRTKFHDRFPEDINHPADDDGFDLFMPVEKVEPDPNERIKEG